MIQEKFFPTKAALFTVISACLIVAIFMGLRMVFGLFTDFFVEDLQCTVTQFGLAIGLQMLMWGMFAPIFGALADKIGSAKVTIIASAFVALGIYLLYSGPNTGIFFQINLGLLIGIGYSWGGFESLAVYTDPVELGIRRYFKLEKNEHLVRLHIGLEDPKDIINDLKKSLKFIK